MKCSLRAKCCILDWSSLPISSDNIFQWSWLSVSLKFPVFHIFQNLISLYLVKPTRGIARQHLIMCGKEPSSVVKSFKSILNKTLQVNKVDCQMSGLDWNANLKIFSPQTITWFSLQPESLRAEARACQCFCLMTISSSTSRATDLPQSLY